MAQRFKREILPATEDRPQIELVRSARRTRTISMQRDGVDEHGNPAYRLLIPAASTTEEVDEHIARLLPTCRSWRVPNSSNGSRFAG